MFVFFVVFRQFPERNSFPESKVTWKKHKHGREKRELRRRGGDSSVIGQFGAGFCTACMVSEKVRVISQKNDDEQHIWESAAGSSYSVQKDIETVDAKTKRATIAT